MARARRDDPDTSHEAAEHATTKADILRSRVFHVMVAHGDWLTHDELYQRFQSFIDTNDWDRSTPQGVRSRVSELYQDGWVERDNPATVKNSRGRRVHQWRAVTDPDRARTNRERLAEENDDEAPTVYVPGPDEHPHVIILPSGTRYATTTDHLEALPIETVIRTVGEEPEVLEQTFVGQWSSTTRSRPIPNEDIFDPAQILYVPADVELDLTQFPEKPDLS